MKISDSLKEVVIVMMGLVVLFIVAGVVEWSLLTLVGKTKFDNVSAFGLAFISVMTGLYEGGKFIEWMRGRVGLKKSV